MQSDDFARLLPSKMSVKSEGCGEKHRHRRFQLSRKKEKFLPVLFFFYNILVRWIYGVEEKSFIVIGGFSIRIRRIMASKSKIFVAKNNSIITFFSVSLKRRFIKFLSLLEMISFFFITSYAWSWKKMKSIDYLFKKIDMRN